MTIQYRVTETCRIGPVFGGKNSRTYESIDGRFRIFQAYRKGDGYMKRAGYEWVLVDLHNVDRVNRSHVFEGYASMKQCRAKAEKIAKKMVK